MANERTMFREGWIHIESTFATDPDTDGSDYVRLPCEALEWTPDQELIPRPYQRSGLGKRTSGAIGGKSGVLKFKTPLVGLSTAAASTVTAVPQTWLTRAMKGCGYTESLGTGTAVIAVPTGTTTTSVIEVDSAAGFAAGPMVMIGGEVRQVIAASTAGTDTITVAPALSSIPAGATVVYAAANYYFDAAAGTDTVAFAVKLDGTQETLLGCKGKWSIGSVDARGRPMIDWEFQVDTFADTSNKSSLPTTLGFKVNPLALSAPFWLGSTKTPIAKFAFDPGAVVTPMPSTQGTQGRAGWLITDEAAKMSATPYLNQTTLRTTFSTPTLQRALMQFGTAHTETFAVVADQCQIGFPAEEDIGGLRGHSLTLDCLESAISAPNFVVGAF